jgi:hypothetical protein
MHYASRKWLWEIDDAATSVTSTGVPNAQTEERTLLYKVVWSTWSPRKISKDGVELDQQRGNVAAGSFSIRGDGTWNKNY